MVRNKHISSIHSTIAQSNRFELTDFTIKSVDNGYSYTTVTITYLPKPVYYLELEIPKSESEKGYLFNGTYCPGPISYTEKFSFLGSKFIPDRVTIW